MKRSGQASHTGDVPFVSVIVPVYKVEKYIRKCIDSILAQTYQNYELILVDDGSPDDCGKICDEYAEKYSFISVIHQQNQGLSGARNHGVLESRGDYITFIDSDDFVTEDYLDYLVGLVQSFHADISAGSHVYQYENKEIKQPREETERGFLEPADALTRMNYAKGVGLTAWAKLYKRELVEANPYPIGKYYEDLATTYKIVGSSTGVAYGNKQIYYWQQRPDSIMHSRFDERQLAGLEATKNQLQYIEKHYPAAVPAAKYRCAAKAVELTDILFTSGGDRSVFRKLKAFMNEHAAEVLKDDHAKASIKIRIHAMRLGYYPAKIAFAIHRFLKKKRI